MCRFRCSVNYLPHAVPYRSFCVEPSPLADGMFWATVAVLLSVSLAWSVHQQTLLHSALAECRAHGSSACAARAAAPAATPQEAPSPDASDSKAPYRVTLNVQLPERHACWTMRNVTLVTHATADRAARVARLCSRWRGPMSVSLFVRRAQNETRAAAVAAMLDAGGACLKRHAALHVVETAPQQRASGDMYAAYPFNVQRNAALDGAVGRHVFLLDADFDMQPAELARERVVSALYHRHMEKMRADAVAASDVAPPPLRNAVPPRSAADGSSGAAALAPLPPDAVAAGVVTVIPAVETVTAGIPTPTSPAELLARLREHEVCAFYGHYCQACHQPTRVERYAQTMAQAAAGGSGSPASSAPVRSYAVNYMDDYEPYVLLTRPAPVDSTQEADVGTRRGGEAGGASWYDMAPPLPRYDERFLGRGFDKMSFFYELARSRRPVQLLQPARDESFAPQRRFVVMVPGPFLVHAGRGDLPEHPTAEYQERQRRNDALMHNFKRAVRRGDDPHAAGAGAVPATAGVVLDTTAAVPSQAAPSAAPASDQDLQRLLVVNLHAFAAFDPAGASLGCVPAGVLPAPAKPASDPAPATDGGPSAALDAAWVQRTEAALSYACSRIDCRALQPGGMRHAPSSLRYRAQWAFTRYLSFAVATLGEPPGTACDFNGAAQLVDCEDACYACAVRPTAAAVDMAVAEHWACSADALGDCPAAVAALVHGTALRNATSLATWQRLSLVLSAWYAVGRCAHPSPATVCDFGGIGTRVPCADLAAHLIR